MAGGIGRGRVTATDVAQDGAHTREPKRTPEAVHQRKPGGGVWPASQNPYSLYEQNSVIFPYPLYDLYHLTKTVIPIYDLIPY